MQFVLRKFHYVLLICVVLSMPFNISHVNINGFFIILLAANSIALFFLSRKEIKPIFSGIVILFLSVYLIHLVGFFKTDNIHEAVFELQKKLSLLIFPIILFYAPRLNHKEVRIILLSFVLSCFLTGIFCLLIATYHFYSLSDTFFFFYHGFSEIAGMHATYLAMYSCFAVAILLNIYFEKVHYFSLKNKIIYYLVLSVLFIMILLLAGRMQIILLIIGLIAYFIFRFNKKINLLKSILGAVAIGVFILGLVLMLPRNRERFKEAINYKGEYSLDKKWGEGQMRYLIWTCAAELIKTNPLTGVGTGDVQDELQKCYLSHQYVSLTYWKDVQFNAHNQFLETTIGLGIAGLLVLLASFFVSLRYALKHKNILYFIFILLFMISCLTESLLERQNGIVFYAFFNSLLFINLFDKIDKE